MDITANNRIDFNSIEYQSNLRLYVQDIDHCNFQQLQYKLNHLYMSLIQKNYSRATALHHLRNVLQ